MRGNPNIYARGQNRHGSIPARAGEPASCELRRRHSKVYPRACGGTAFGATQPIPAMGLSPRVRGNRARVERRRTLGRVYPRACGGTRSRLGIGNARYGLSPRVRGNPGMTLIAPHAGQSRSIPARAGEPRVQLLISDTGQVRVYPRACGGTSEKPLRPSYAYIPGLSPRVRGNLHDDRAARQRLALWVYPRACGGTSRYNYDADDTVSKPVYPRACGGTVEAPPSYAYIPGLSPRVRGNLQVIHADEVRNRSIPARAGEPAVGGSERHTQLTSVYPRACGGTAR